MRKAKMRKAKRFITLLLAAALALALGNAALAEGSKDIVVLYTNDVTMLYRMADSPGVTGRVTDVFSDCWEGAWYADAVLWASRNNIVEGRAPKTFAPEAVLTRQEMAAILYRYAVYTGAARQAGQSLEYSDAADIADWALTGVAYCASAGLMRGVTESVFDP